MKGYFCASKISRFYPLVSLFLVIVLLFSSIPPITSEALAQTLPIIPPVSPAPLAYAPVANDDAYAVDQGDTLDVAAPGVLGNDTDDDADPLTAIKVSDPAHGILTLNADGSFNYVHDGSETTSDSFTYKASDGTNDSNEATVNITINPIVPANNAPVANDDAYTVDQGGTLDVTAPGVLGNDTDGDEDPLTATKISDPTHGILTLNADGSFNYVHDGNETTSDLFTYKANDGTDDSNEAAVTMTVNPAIAPPIVTNATGASNITTNSARLSGEITNTGTEDPTVHIYWGDSDSGTNSTSWAHDENLGILGAGTFYKDITDLIPNTIYYYRCFVQNSGGSSWAATTASFTTTSDQETTIISTNTTLDAGEHTFQHLIINNNAILTLNSNTSASGFKGVHIIADNLTVESGSSISADGKGYGPASGPGAGGAAGQFVYKSGGGGGYGGNGGAGSGGTGGTAYDSLTVPIDLGSGGGKGYSGTGGAGGGAIWLDVSETITVDGTISTNGSNGTGNYPGSGGGSGGSIYITTNTLTGSGTISSCGGNAGVGGGDGGGGRIAIYYTTDSYAGTMLAHGGSGGQRGGAGTIFTKSTSQAHGNLLLDNNGHAGAATPVTGANEFDNITVGNQANLSLAAGDTLDTPSLILQSSSLIIGSGATFSPSHISVQSSTITNDGNISWATIDYQDGIIINNGMVSAPEMVLTNITFRNNGTLDIPDNNVTIGAAGILEQDSDITLANLTILSGGVLSHTAGDSINLTISNDLFVQDGGSINVDGKGYGAASGPGAGGAAGEFEYKSGGGGGYGGKGGAGNGLPGGTTYGSVIAPTDIGSGGGKGYSGDGGAGGGAIWLDVSGTLTIEGTISANGNNGSGSVNFGSGGGSGGSIYITTDTFAGSGTISASGGSGALITNAGGGGGGGRIAIYRNTASGFNGAIVASGGAGYQGGEEGTIHIPGADLVISNISWSPASFVDGDEVTLTATVENTGTGDVLTSFYVQFKIDDNPIGTKTISGILAAGNTTQVSQTWTATAGTHTVAAYADMNDRVSETDEANNEFSRPLSGVLAPDLIISDISWFPSDTIIEENLVILTATVENTGIGDTLTSFDVQFQIDGSPIGTSTISGGLPSDNTTEVSQIWTATLGSHTVTAYADINDAVTESDETNNELSLALPEVTEPPYNANAVTDKSVYNRGESVTISGTVTSTENGQPVPDVPVTIRVDCRGFLRTFNVQSDSNGSYSYVFKPSIVEAGNYIISVTHPDAVSFETDASFEILGLYVSPRIINLEMAQNSTKTTTVTVKNIGASELTGVVCQVIDSDDTDGVTATIAPTSFNLASGQSRNLEVEVTADPSTPEQVSFEIQAICDQGSIDTCTLSVKLHAAVPVASVSPYYIDTGLNPGGVQVDTITVANIGYGTMEDVVLVKPNLPWISISTDLNLGDIAPSEAETFDIVFCPPQSIEDGIYTDQISITSLNHQTKVFSIRVAVTSGNTGGLKFVVKNQFQEPVPGARASLINQNVYTVTFNGETNQDGELTLSGLPVGRYDYQVTAALHDRVVDTALVEVGVDKEIDVVMGYSFLKVDWEIAPTDIQDVYEVTHHVTYDTSSPLPYIDVDELIISLLMMPGSTYEGQVTWTNLNDQVSALNGIIQATPSSDWVNIEFLADEIPELKPGESATIPFIVTLLEHHSPGPSLCDEFGIQVGAKWDQVCVYNTTPAGQPPDPDYNVYRGVPTQVTQISVRPACEPCFMDSIASLPEMQTSGQVSASMGALKLTPGISGCFKTFVGCERLRDVATYDINCIGDVYSCFGISPEPPESPGSPGARNIASCLQCFSDVYCPPETVTTGYTGYYSPPSTGYKEWSPAPSFLGPCVLSPETMCARVKLDIQQETTLERQGFEALLELGNLRTDYDMTVFIDLDINDPQGNPANDLFFASTPTMEGIQSLDGGVIPAGGTASVQWLLIPTPGAGGTEAAGIKYTAKAKITYTLIDKTFEVETWPDEITVLPMPELILDYFLPAKVYGDDLMTQGVIEKSVPFIWGVRVGNSGYGPAQNLTINSAQPTIIEATEGMPITFELLGTWVNGAIGNNTLNINFGDIQPEKFSTAGWQMVCPITGEFSEYTAEFTHSNSLGGQATSLIQDVQTHVLVKEFMNDLPGQDQVFDFLVDSDDDGVPDQIFDSSGADTTIRQVAAVMDGTPSPEDPTASIIPSESVTGEWVYMAIDSPAVNGYQPATITRSDGKVLNNHNHWLRENKLHLVDYGTGESYTVLYGLAEAIIVEPISGLSTTEAGGTATFTVVLSTQPAADVTANLSSDDTSEGTIAPTSLTFTPENWNQPQTVTITGVADSIADGDVTYHIITARAISTDPKYNGLDPDDVTMVNVDTTLNVSNSATGATYITNNSARLNGEVSNTGGDNPTVHIYWGDNDGGTDPASWDNDVNLGAITAGAFHADIIGLNPDTTYYYRCFAQNSAGPAWATSTSSFVAGSRKLLGADDVAPTTTQVRDYLSLTRYSADFPGILKQIKVKCTASGNVKVAIYSDNNSQPANLLGTNNDDIPVSAGWNTIDITPVEIAIDTDYWLAFISDVPCVGYINSGGPSWQKPTTYDGFSFPAVVGTDFAAFPSHSFLLAGWGAVPGTFSTATEQTSSQSNLTETLLGQTLAVNNAAATGDLSGTFAFTDFKMVSVETGSFANKGFFTAEWQTNLEGLDYTGSWQGMFYLDEAVNRIYLKGTASGDISGIVDGYLTESGAGSGTYDQFQIDLQLSQLGIKAVSGTITLTGTATYQATQEYPSTQLYVLQTSLAGTSSGDYTGALDIVMTHLRVADSNNLYYGQGFSIISYNSDVGSGSGYTYDSVVSEWQIMLSGMFGSPLLGIVSGVLNESQSPRTLSINIDRIDLGAPPEADLRVRVWGPERVSPGQTVTYTIEYRNDGLKAATDAVVFDYLDFLVEHKSASTGAYYNPYSHQVNWDLGALPPKSHGYLTIQTEVIWGLPQGLALENIAYIMDFVSHSDEVGIFINGISYDPDSNADKNEKDGLAKAANLRWVPVYQETGFLDGGFHVFCASQNVPTDVNGLGAEQLEEIRGSDEGKYEICAGHSGGTTILVELAKQGLITGKELVLISPQMITQADLEDIRDMYEEDATGNPISGFEKISVLQGDDLMEGWAESLVRHLLPTQDKNRDGLLNEEELEALPKVQDLIGEGGIEELIENLEAAEGKEFKGLKFDVDTPGYNFSIEWQDGTKTEMQVTPDIEDGNGIEAIDIDNITHSGWLKFLTKWLNMDEHDGKFPTNEDQAEFQSLVNGWFRNLLYKLSHIISAAHDPNYLSVSPQGYIKPGDTLTYTINYENEGEGIAYGVYISDPLQEDLDASTLNINDGGIYDPQTRTIKWFIGEVQSRQEGSVSFSVNAKGDVPDGTEILNFAIVYFPSVPEETRTNGTVSAVMLHPQQIIVDPTSGLLTTEAGDATTFDIVLTYQPRADVAINLSSDNPSEGTVSPGGLTFTPDNWDQPQMVTVTGVGDSVLDGDVTYHIITAPAVSADPDYSGLDPDDVTLVNIDITPTVAPPTVTNSTGTSDIASDAARLNGEITATGGEDPTVHICWGPTDGGTTLENWANDIDLGIKGLGTFYQDIAELNPSTTYYYRCYAANSAGMSWAADSASFITSSAPTTELVTVQLKDSNGNPLSDGIVQYYSGGWQAFGTTDASGQVSKELLPNSYKFRMTYADASNDKTQDVGLDPTVVFDTVNVTVQLKDSGGSLIDTGTVKYYAGGWKDFGTTSGGQVSKELLPNSYKFRMTYAGASNDKTQDVGLDSTVVFETGQVHSDSTNCIQYYAGGWQTFTQDMEMLPGTYTFRFNDGMPDESYNIVVGTVNHIH